MVRLVSLVAVGSDETSSSGGRGLVVMVHPGVSDMTGKSENQYCY